MTNLNEIIDQRGVFGMQMLNEGASKCFSNNFDFNVHPFKIESDKNKWIKYGIKDLMPNTFIKIYSDSGQHNALVNLTAKLISGSRFKFSVPETVCVKDEFGFYKTLEVKSNFNEDELIKSAEMWAKNVYLDKYRVDAGAQMALFGGYYGFRHVGRGRIPRENFKQSGTDTYVRYLIVEPFENMRLGEYREFREGEFISTDHFISDDYSYLGYHKVKSYEDFLNRGSKKIVGKIPAYSCREKDGKPLKLNEGVYSKLVGRHTSYRKFYPTPYYESKKAMNYFAIDYMLSEYDLHDIREGFPLEYILLVNRKPLSDPEKEAAKKKDEVQSMRNDYKGYSGGRTAVMWAAPEMDEQGKRINTDPVTIITIPTSKSNTRLDKMRSERDISATTAHGLPTPEIIGMASATKSGFSNDSEKLKTGMGLYLWNTVLPQQQLLIKDIQDELHKANIFVEVSIESDKPMLETLSETLLSQYWTGTEIRNKFGSAALTEEQTEELEQKQGSDGV